MLPAAEVGADDGAGSASARARVPITLSTCASDVTLCPEHTGLRWPHAPSVDGHLATSGGGGVGDFNRDGWQDLFVPSGGEAPDRLYLNNGDGTFTDRAAEAGVAHRHLGYAVAVGDYDADGWPDIFVTSFGPPDLWISMAGHHRLYRNNGDGSFAEVAATAGVNGTSSDQPTGTAAAFGDYDLDGRLDLAVGAWFPSPDGNALFHNEGSGVFRNVSDALPPAVSEARAFTSAFADMDRDGVPELLIAADYGTSRYLRNDGAGTFLDLTGTSNTGLDRNGMGAAVADFDNDGLLDWFVTSVWTRQPLDRVPGTGNYLYRNRGDHRFESVAGSAGIEDGGWGWGAVAVDLDHDGWLDIVQTNGWKEPNGAGALEWADERTRVFHNRWPDTGELRFVDVAKDAGLDHRLPGRGVVHLDYDNDGDQDLVIFNNREIPTLVRNDVRHGAHSNWLRVFLDTEADRGVAPDGFGSWVSVSAGDHTQHRYVGVSSGYLGPSQLSAHFGLGAAATVATMTVHWADGTVTERRQIPANQTLVVRKRPD